jgi:hypothetical protein
MDVSLEEWLGKVIAVTVIVAIFVFFSYLVFSPLDRFSKEVKECKQSGGRLISKKLLQKGHDFDGNPLQYKTSKLICFYSTSEVIIDE